MKLAKLILIISFLILIFTGFAVVNTANVNIDNFELPYVCILRHKYIIR